MDGELKVVTQNCFFGKKIRKIIQLINNNSADVYAFQETTGNNFAKKVQTETKYNYILSKPVKIPFPPMHFYNAIFTQLPIIDSGELSWSNKRNKRKDSFGGKALWALLRKNSHTLKIYCCHFCVRNHGAIERREMIIDIINDALKFDGPIIIAGDMNTVIPDMKSHRWLVKLWHQFPDPPKEVFGNLHEKNEKYLFVETVKKLGFEELSDLTKNTWCLPLTGIEAFDLKLDWMSYKNCKALSCNMGNWIGDHRSIIGKFKLT